MCLCAQLQVCIACIYIVVLNYKLKKKNVIIHKELTPRQNKNDFCPDKNYNV
jgi:hypothetical protein